jgi:methyl-accepting chemotaxis protein
MFSNMTVKSKLMVLLSIMLAGFILIGIIGAITASSIASADKSLYEKNTVGISKIGKFLADFKDVRINYYQMKLGTMPFADYKTSTNKFFNESFVTFNKEYSETYIDENDKKSHEELKTLVLAYKAAYETYVHLTESGASPEQIDNHLKTVFAPAGKAVAKQVDEIVTNVTAMAKKSSESNSDAASNGKIEIIVLVLALLGLSLLVGFSIIKGITGSIAQTQAGLVSFFRFLNRESTKAELIDLKSEDEFGQMAKVINENITSIEKGLVADANAVANAVQVANRVKAGHLNEQINVVPNNPQLAELRSVLNEMLTGLNGNVEKVLSVLKVYANNDFNPRADKASLQGEVASLIDGVNNLGNEISTMLGASLRNGMELQGDAGSLKQAVEALSTASNEQAASLEETAAAMEEMTSNVQQNAQKANDMASMAAQTDASAKEGAELAHRTATAMTEIQEATNSINSAVAIIENIAFQTNILSLNAAVEAATAGEAGKGFAVVAQEVRNLANRSADAAKEIKALAEQAASKSSEGMSIATELTRGFEVIAGKIEQTTMLVQDVSNASREQMQGISQINTAVTQLDQMTQENAKIAAEADNIANSTIDKAQAMVTDASSKNFVGKSDIQASGMHHNTARPAHKPAARSAHKAAPAAKPATFVPTAKSEDDIWESF